MFSPVSDVLPFYSNYDKLNPRKYEYDTYAADLKLIYVLQLQI
jgi:hypothetical protein